MSEEKKITAADLNAQDATLLADLDDAMANCMKCGNCQAVCPIYRETHQEQMVARGKISLMQGVLSGRLPVSKKFDHIMAMCLNCKSCAANCPCGVEADELILRARNAAVKARGLHPVKKNVFRLLANRSLFDAALKLGGMFGWMTFKEIPGKNAVVSRLPMPGMDPERATPPLAAKPLRSQYPEVIVCPHPKYRVAFFTGCTINYMYTDIGKAVIDVLRANEVEIVLPTKQHCCGTPVHVSGEFALANEMAKHTIEVFEHLDVDYIVGACGSCVEALKYYPEWLSDDPAWRERAEKMAAKVREISELLVEKGYRKDMLGNVDKVVTMHDPCHMVRGLGITAQPREILKSIPGLTFREMKEHDRCCGSGGSFCMAHYEMSRKINDRKCDNIAATHADYVATSCPSCRMHITDGIIHRKLPQVVYHPIQLLAASYHAGGFE
ncbi:(Fe-S)-binding protein [uncultured Selenomonas sp.]|uniref:(Fe-S)-binding protein n=1 Tax=uncultured Selenomonas sp. TaxID=159275 RepID=UPI00280380B1|nr:(Fe-S)-binding protein [uncultured Selenomonas sp.]